MAINLPTESHFTSYDGRSVRMVRNEDGSFDRVFLSWPNDLMGLMDATWVVGYEECGHNVVNYSDRDALQRAIDELL